MLLLFASRHEMIGHIGLGTVDTMVELGVYKGDFSEHCHATLRPKRLVLVDFWDYDKYEFLLETAPQMQKLRAVFAQYFGDSPRTTLAQAYDQVCERFRDRPGVEILRRDVAEAAGQFADRSLDVIYLDASHTYEYVLRDLHLWYPKLAAGGLFICNDFVESGAAARQNLGVIPAYLTFAKRHETHPIALSMDNWSDLYFSNQPTSPLIENFTAGLLSGGSAVLEVPPEVLANYQHVLVTLPNGAQRSVPSLSVTPRLRCGQ